MKLTSLLAGVLALGMVACDRHEWETVDKDGDGEISSAELGTKALYTHGDGSHGEGHGDTHGEHAGDSHANEKHEDPHHAEKPHKDSHAQDEKKDAAAH